MKTSVQSMILITLLIVSVLTSIFLVPDLDVKGGSVESQAETIVAVNHLHPTLEYVIETDGSAMINRLGEFMIQNDSSLKGYRRSGKSLLFVTVLSVIFMCLKSYTWKGVYCANSGNATYERVIVYILNQDGKK